MSFDFDPASLGDLVVTGDGSLSMEHPGYGECYHSKAGANFEAFNLYIKASGFDIAIQEKNTLPLCILDVGLGLGYNALATLETWYDSPQTSRPLQIISLEKNDLLVSSLVENLGPWQHGWKTSWLSWCSSLKVNENKTAAAIITHQTKSDLKCFWQISIGDASMSNVPEMPGGYVFIWQDPFSSKKNPELWSQDWFRKLHRLSAKNAMLMTYSVARLVKDNLVASNWKYELISTPGQKKRWLRAIPL